MSINETIDFFKGLLVKSDNWIFRSYCASDSGHIVPLETDVISRPNIHINL